MWFLRVLVAVGLIGCVGEVPDPAPKHVEVCAAIGDAYAARVVACGLATTADLEDVARDYAADCRTVLDDNQLAACVSAMSTISCDLVDSFVDCAVR
jgi:hypothetical protein